MVRAMPHLGVVHVDLGHAGCLQRVAGPIHGYDGVTVSDEGVYTRGTKHNTNSTQKVVKTRRSHCA
jgi:hypothetical protein